MGGGSTIKKKAEAAFLQIDMDLLAMAGINPDDPIVCSERTKLPDVLKSFLSVHCLSCPCKMREVDLEGHMSKTHNKKNRMKTCARCHQAVDSLSYHELHIPKQFHKFFRRD